MSAAPGRLVVNADDLGVTRGTTLGIVKAHRDGIVTSASLACTLPGYRFAVDECVRKCPQLGVGLHFTLTSGTPVADPKRVPLLVAADDRFRWSFSSLMAASVSDKPAGLFDQIEIELEAQLSRLEADGIKPDHIDGERHVQLIPGIFERVANAARRHGIPFVRAGRDVGKQFLKPADIAALTFGGGFVKWGVLATLTAAARGFVKDGVGSPEFFASYLYTGLTASFLPTLLASTPPAGVTEVMVHPSLIAEDGTAPLGDPALDGYLTSRDRQAELDACVAARGKTGAWQLTNFRTLAA